MNNRKTWPTTDAERSAYRDWQYEVANGDTVLGFRDWLDQQTTVRSNESKGT